MPLVPEMTAANFAIEVTVDDFLAIIDEDKKRLMTKGTLFDIIDRIPGVSDVEYNGHFGPCIFYKLDAERISEEGHAPILAAIAKYLSVARH
jgi:hypothetical protein